MKTALEKLHEDMMRPPASFRQIQELQDVMKRYSPESQARELLKQFEPGRQMREMIERTAIPNQIRQMLDGTSIAAEAQRMLEQYFPKNLLAQQAEHLQRAAALKSVGESGKAYEKYLTTVTDQRDWLEKLQNQPLGELSIKNLAQNFGQIPSAFTAMEAAKRSLDTLIGSFRHLDISAHLANEEMMKKADEAAQSIAYTASGEVTLKDAVDQIVAGIQVQQNPTVQLILFLFFRKMLDWLIAGAIGAAMGVYAPQVLGESPQAASKAVKEIAREAVGSAELLVEYRYVSVKELIVRQNSRALSPEIGRFSFGRVVKLVAKDKDFSLVIWTDTKSGAVIQGWVFSRYLRKFT